MYLLQTRALKESSAIFDDILQWGRPDGGVYRDRKSKLLKHCVTAFRTDIRYHNNVFVIA